MKRVVLCGLAAVLPLCVGCADLAKLWPFDQPTPQTQPTEVLVFRDGKWITGTQAVPGTPAGDLATGRDLLKGGHYDEACRALKRAAKKHAAAPEREEMMYWRGEAEFRRDRYEKAYLVYEELLADYEGSPYMDSILGRYYQIAEAFLEGRRRRVLGVPLLKDSGYGVALLERVQAHDPTGPLADRAVMRIANHYFHKGTDYRIAAQYYDELIQLYPRSPFQAHAHIRGALAKCYSYQGCDYCASDLDSARKMLESARRRFPDTFAAVSKELQSEGRLDGGLDRYLHRIRLQEAHRAFTQAAYYERAGRMTAAKQYYHLVKTEFPETKWATEATRCLERL